MKNSILILVNFDIFCARACICSASYLVGTKMTPKLTQSVPWMYLEVSSISLSSGIRKPPVLPVPFLARAMMLLRAVMSGMDYYCMGVGTR